jgi:hypothetical protein
MSERQSYVVVDAAAADHDTAAFCGAVFDVLGALVETAHVDAYSDYDDQMPGDIRAAELWLRERGLRRGDADPGLGIVIEASDDVGWAIARAYTPWSVHIALYDADGVNVVAFHDGGHAITVNLSDSRAAALLDRIAPGHELVPVSEWTLPPI